MRRLLPTPLHHVDEASSARDAHLTGPAGAVPAAAAARTGGPPPGLDLAAEYADARRTRHDGRPWLMLNMIATIDGASALEGLSGGLGGSGDRAIFSVIRTIADVIVVGASTVRAEGYGPPKKPGQQVAIVTRSGDLDWSSTLFTSGRAIAVLPEDGPTVPVSAVRAGHGQVDLPAALTQLSGTVALCEGGPTLNGQLLASGLVDELCLTLAPRLASGTERRIVVGPETVVDMELAHLLEEDGFLFARYVRRR